MKNIITLFLGLFFGWVLLSSEVISWYRIQEMFYFDNFHMYGIIGSAIVTGMLSIFLIKKFKVKDAKGNSLEFKHPPVKPKANILGGVAFGFGWAMTGACPGPLYALAGAGYWTHIITLVFAAIGVLVYGLLQKRLPH